MAPSTTEFASILAAIPDSAWITLAIILALVLFRNGIITIKATALEGVAFNNIQADIERLRAENAKLMSHKLRLISFATHVLEHFGSCGVCPEQEKSRNSLREEFNSILKEIS